MYFKLNKLISQIVNLNMNANTLFTQPHITS